MIASYILVKLTRFRLNLLILAIHFFKYPILVKSSRRGPSLVFKYFQDGFASLNVAVELKILFKIPQRLPVLNLTCQQFMHFKFQVSFL